MSLYAILTADDISVVDEYESNSYDSDDDGNRESNDTPLFCRSVSSTNTSSNRSTPIAFVSSPIASISRDLSISPLQTLSPANTDSSNSNTTRYIKEVIAVPSPTRRKTMTRITVSEVIAVCQPVNVVDFLSEEADFNTSTSPSSSNTPYKTDKTIYQTSNRKYRNYKKSASVKNIKDIKDIDNSIGTNIITNRVVINRVYGVVFLMITAFLLSLNMQPIQRIKSFMLDISSRIKTNASIPSHSMSSPLSLSSSPPRNPSIVYSLKLRPLLLSNQKEVPEDAVIPIINTATTVVKYSTDVAILPSTSIAVFATATAVAITPPTTTTPIVTVIPIVKKTIKNKEIKLIKHTSQLMIAPPPSTSMVSASDSNADMIITTSVEKSVADGKSLHTPLSSKWKILSSSRGHSYYRRPTPLLRSMRSTKSNSLLQTSTHYVRDTSSITSYNIYTDPALLSFMSNHRKVPRTISSGKRHKGGSSTSSILLYLPLMLLHVFKSYVVMCRDIAKHSYTSISNLHVSIATAVDANRKGLSSDLFMF